MFQALSKTGVSISTLEDCVILVGHCRYGEARYSYVGTPRKRMWSEKQAFLFEPQAEPEPRVLRASVMLRGPLVHSQVAEVGE